MSDINIAELLREISKELATATEALEHTVNSADFEAFKGSMSTRLGQLKGKLELLEQGENGKLTLFKTETENKIILLSKRLKVLEQDKKKREQAEEEASRNTRSRLWDIAISALKWIGVAVGGAVLAALGMS